jgi:hypothetical protein
MQSKEKKADPLEVLPDVLLNMIAHKVGNISQAGVEGPARRLGLPIMRTATGRAAVSPRAAVLIIEELRKRHLERNALALGLGPSASPAGNGEVRAEFLALHTEAKPGRSRDGA